MRKWLQDKKRRLALSAAVGMTMCALGGAYAEKLPVCAGDFPACTAWWGTLYPKFCFAEKGEADRVKISFRLAELLDW